MSEELDIRSLSVTAAAKLLKVAPKTLRMRFRRGSPCKRQAHGPAPLRVAAKRDILAPCGAPRQA